MRPGWVFTFVKTHHGHGDGCCFPCLGMLLSVTAHPLDSGLQALIRCVSMFWLRCPFRHLTLTAYD